MKKELKAIKKQIERMTRKRSQDPKIAYRKTEKKLQPSIIQMTEKKPNATHLNFCQPRAALRKTV